MTYQYQFKTFDHGHGRTDEGQANILTGRAFTVWNQWCKRDGNGELIGIMGQDPELDKAIQALYRALKETEIFYSGKHAGRRDPQGGAYD